MKFLHNTTNISKLCKVNKYLNANNKGLMPQLTTPSLPQTVHCMCSMSLSPLLWLPSSLVQSDGIHAVPLLGCLFTQSMTCRFYGHVGWHPLSAVHLTFPMQHIHKIRHIYFIWKIPTRGTQKQAIQVDFVQTNLPT